MFESISIWYESTNNKETNLYIKIKLKFSNVDEVSKGLFECMDRMLDYQERLKVDIQLDFWESYCNGFLNIKKSHKLVDAF